MLGYDIALLAPWPSTATFDVSRLIPKQVKWTARLRYKGYNKGCDSSNRFLTVPTLSSFLSKDPTLRGFS
jgi:hypothetical protein